MLAAAQTQGFSALDYGIVLAYLVLTLLVGARFARRQKSVEDFFIAGRSIGWFPAGVSVVATIFSAISFVGIPAEVFQHDLRLLAGVFTPPILTFFIIKVLLPFYHGLNVISIYEYLERRFSISVRWLASTLFILMRIGWLATMTYATAVVVSEITPLSLVESGLLMGAVTIAYTYLGGMSAVIWTDFMQFFVFMAGICSILFVIAARVDNGLVGVMQIAAEQGKLRFLDFSLDPTTRMTTWGVILAALFLGAGQYGTDQMIVQRYLSTKSPEAARRTLWFNAIFMMPFTVLIYLFGLMLFAFYHSHPELATGLLKPDKVVPYFIVHEVPRGISGLIVAAILAATMSSMSSGLNSLATATVIDFYRRGKRSNLPERHYLVLSRVLTIVYGVIAVALGLVIGQLGTVYEISMKVNWPFPALLLGVFLLGIFTRRANARGAIVGVAAGIGTVCCLIFCTKVSFLWHTAVAPFAALGVGWLASLMWRSPSRTQTDSLTYGDRSTPGAG